MENNRQQRQHSTSTAQNPTSQQQQQQQQKPAVEKYKPEWERERELLIAPAISVTNFFFLASICVNVM